MPRLWSLGVLAAVVVGGWYFVTHYEVGGLESLTVEPRADAPDEVSGVAQEGQQDSPVPQAQGNGTIRVATINLGPFDRQKLGKRHVVGYLVKVIRQFDVVAIQDVRARNQGLLVEFVEQLNSEGRHYDFVLPSEVGRDPVEQYSAFLFDQASVHLDRNTVYSVQDEAGRFRREPLVASFQARGPNEGEAFTFTLINVHTDPRQTVIELDLLDDVFRAVRDSGRGEDDIVLLGDLNADERHLGQLGEVPNIAWAIFDLPTTTRGTRLVDNILFDVRATAEFTGRSGVVDLIREFNLTMREAVEISDHLPVWAEFSVYEGGQPGQVASHGVDSTR